MGEVRLLGLVLAGSVLIGSSPALGIIIRHFISLEPAFFWATLPLYSTVDCTVGGSKESRGSTVTLYVYPAVACGGYVGASSSRVAFRAVDVVVSCLAAAGLAGCRAGIGVLLQMSIRDCCVLLVWVLRFGCWSLRFCFLCWLGCLLRLVLGE